MILTLIAFVIVAGVMFALGTVYGQKLEAKAVAEIVFAESYSLAVRAQLLNRYHKFLAKF